MGESLEGLRLGIWHPQWKNSKETLSQIIWKLRMNTQGCPQISTCTPWHGTYAPTYVYSNALTTHVRVQTKLCARLRG